MGLKKGSKEALLAGKKAAETRMRKKELKLYSNRVEKNHVRNTIVQLIEEDMRIQKHMIKNKYDFKNQLIDPLDWEMAIMKINNIKKNQSNDTNQNLKKWALEQFSHKKQFDKFYKHL
jgi:hypothetical protein